MRFLIAFIATMIAPLPVFALSCVAPSIEATYDRAQQSPDTYVVVHGRLVTDETKMPRTDTKTQVAPEMTRIPAKIMGRSLSVSGFQVPFERKVTLEVACFGPWCGSIADGSDVLAFLRRDAGGYALEINPCGGDVFVTPQVKMLKQVESCFKRGQC